MSERLWVVTAAWFTGMLLGVPGAIATILAMLSTVDFGRPPNGAPFVALFGGAALTGALVTFTVGAVTRNPSRDTMHAAPMVVGCGIGFFTGWVFLAQGGPETVTGLVMALGVLPFTGTLAGSFASWDLPSPVSGLIIAFAAVVAMYLGS
jgi:hypothetical protein